MKTIVSLTLVVLTGCTGQQERSTLQRFRDAESALHEPPPLDGRLDVYVAHASAGHPAVRAELERWRAASLRVGTARRWPRPSISYAVFLRPVETRVGPQRQKVGLRVPMATGSRRGQTARLASMADAASRRLTARVLALRHAVADAYWMRWLIEARRRTLAEQLVVLDGFAELVRTRIALGSASLADVQQIELRRARLHDNLASLGPAQRRADAMLRRASGVDADELPVVETPPALERPSEPLEALRAATRERPELAMHEDLARASESAADASRAERFPTVALGLDWIETRSARAPNVPGSGDDALMLGATLTLPTDVGIHRDAERAARAEASAHRADAEAMQLGLIAEVDTSFADIEDAVRRAELYEDSLLPQAQIAYESALGQYQVGRTGIATVLNAQRELLELALDLDRIRVTFATSWAALEHAVGRPIRTTIRTSSAGGDDV